MFLITATITVGMVCDSHDDKSKCLFVVGNFPETILFNSIQFGKRDVVVLLEIISFGSIMGSELSKPEAPRICVDCDKKNQKDLPVDDPTSAEGSPCETLYMKVSSCMDSNNGQITACVQEWKLFQKCHEGSKKLTGKG